MRDDQHRASHHPHSLDKSIEFLMFENVDTQISQKFMFISILSIQLQHSQ